MARAPTRGTPTEREREITAARSAAARRSASAATDALRSSSAAVAGGGIGLGTQGFGRCINLGAQGTTVLTGPSNGTAGGNGGVAGDKAGEPGTGS